ncbi:MAG: hypothetical protein VX185_09385 [Pseudomonadota bacterium]|nr:hypothetical protein [Pseudomonadota bacterium]
MKNIKYLMLAGAALNMAACGGGSDDVENDVVEIIEEVDNSGNLESPATPTTPVVNPVEVVTGDNLTARQFHNIFANEDKVWRVNTVSDRRTTTSAEHFNKTQFLLQIENKVNSVEKWVKTCLPLGGFSTEFVGTTPQNTTLGSRGYLFPEWNENSDGYNFGGCDAVTKYSYDGVTAKYEVTCGNGATLKIDLTQTTYSDIYASDLQVISDLGSGINQSGKACSVMREHHRDIGLYTYFNIIGKESEIPYAFSMKTHNISLTPGSYDLGTNIPPTMTADQENRGSITIQRYSSDRNSPFGYSQNGLGAPGVITFDHHQLDDVSAIVNAVYNSGETIQISFDSNL